MPQPSKRLEWLDAMRGFTMLLVVTYHVAHVSFGITDKYSSVQPFLVLFRMPLFFFVSGFLAYKVSTPSYVALALKKLKVQVVPALVFLVVSVLLLHKNFADTFLADLRSPTKGGYWFTWVLLHMFLVYYLFDWLSSKLKHLQWLPIVALWVVMVVLYALSYMPPVMKLLNPEFRKFLDWSSIIQTVHYFQYFLFGNLVRRFWSQAQRAMDSRWLFPALVVVAFVAAGDCLVWHHLKFMWRNLPLTLASYSLLGLVVMFFRHYQETFTHERPLGRAKQFVGRRTLDVYLLHFLFLPTLPQVGQWMDHHRHNFVLDFTLTASVAVVVIAFCLVTSALLRVSPLLSEWLFGVKKSAR